MASFSTAARTNLTSVNVSLDEYQKLGEGQFRIAYAGTYIGGNRNSQEAVCKCFKQQFQAMEDEYFQADEDIANRAIRLAEEWNQFSKYKILVTLGTVHTIGYTQYMVEPLIRYFTKFTSNNGWIASDEDEGWCVLAMEAFSHFTYQKSGGQLIVCDLQGRYRSDRGGKSRFELTDPAICSRRRNFGPTDLGEKGIESFFANHYCNEFCHSNGNQWSSPRTQKNWFASSSTTSMIHSSMSNMLQTNNRAQFNSQLQPFYEDDEDDSD